MGKFFPSLSSTFILTLPFLFLLTGCHQTPYPDWYRTPPVDTSRYYYGLGEGETDREALKNGVLEIAQKIETRVTGEVKFKDSYSNGERSLEIEQSSLQKLPLLTLFDLQIIRRQYLEGKYLVLVRLDKVKNRELLYRNALLKLNLIDKFIYSKIGLTREKIEELLKILDTQIIPRLHIAQILGKNIDSAIKRAYFYKIKLLKLANKNPSLIERIKNFFRW